MCTDFHNLVTFFFFIFQAPAAFGLVSFLLHEGFDRNRVRRHLGVFSAAAPLLALITYFGLSQVSDPDNYSLVWDWGYFLCINTLRLQQNGCHFADDLFNRIFLNKNVWISLKISLKSVPKGPIANIPALVQIMAWCRPGDKPLSEPMKVSLTTYILGLNELMMIWQFRTKPLIWCPWIKSSCLR